jgi:poly(3-hydroxybutyrate) depolymerase
MAQNLDLARYSRRSGRARNASAQVRQWIDIHQVDEADATQDEVDGQPRMSWRDSSGAVVIEHYAIDGICAMVNSYPSDREIASPSQETRASCVDERQNRRHS